MIVNPDYLLKGQKYPGGYTPPGNNGANNGMLMVIEVAGEPYLAMYSFTSISGGVPSTGMYMPLNWDPVLKKQIGFEISLPKEPQNVLYGIRNDFRNVEWMEKFQHIIIEDKSAELFYFERAIPPKL